MHFCVNLCETSKWRRTGLSAGIQQDTAALRCPTTVYVAGLRYSHDVSRSSSLLGCAMYTTPVVPQLTSFHKGLPDMITGEGVFASFDTSLRPGRHRRACPRSNGRLTAQYKSSPLKKGSAMTTHINGNGNMPNKAIKPMLRAPVRNHEHPGRLAALYCTVGMLSISTAAAFGFKQYLLGSILCVLLAAALGLLMHVLNTGVRTYQYTPQPSKGSFTFDAPPDPAVLPPGTKLAPDDTTILGLDYKPVQSKVKLGKVQCNHAYNVTLDCMWLRCFAPFACSSSLFKATVQLVWFVWLVLWCHCFEAFKHTCS